MKDMNGRKNQFRGESRFLFLFFSFAILSLPLLAEHSEMKLYPSEYSDYLYEINEIRFEGNENIKDFELQLLINSTVTDKSPVFGIMDYYYTNMRNNEYSPVSMLKYIEELAEQYQNEIIFFNEPVAEDDAASIASYYNILGFHEIEVDYTFRPDSTEIKNILTFYIKEGPRYKVKKVDIRGLETVDGGKRYRDYLRDVERQVGKEYNEDILIETVGKLNYEVKNSGYFYSKYKILPVWSDEEDKTDIINVIFEPGLKQTIGECKYVNSDTTSKTRDIATSVKMRYSKIYPGKTYRISAVQETEKNLNNPGLFEKVYVDTFNITAPDTLNFMIATQLANRYEVDAGIFLNHTPADNNVNSGMEGRFTFMNPFGGGEEMVFYGNITAKDVNNLITSRKFEGKLGMNFFQYTIWYVNRTMIGGAGNIEYSKNNMDGFLVDHWYLPKISFPWYLKKYTHFNKITFNLSLEGEYPRQSTIGLDSSFVDKENTNVVRRLVFFETLDDYWNEPGAGFRLWSGAIAGISVIGDHRNHPFSPTHGFYTSMNLEAAGALGIAEFVNIHLTHRQYAFQKHHKNIVHAYQFNIGKIFYDRNDESKYVPFESQYFCGGAGSNRGWSARELHASDITPVNDGSSSADSMLTPEKYRRLSNIYGNSGIFEGSYELRYNFIKHSGLADINKDRISSFGLVAFLDIGNAYGWFIDENDKPEEKTFASNVSYFLENIAVGSGLGIRYETPIGPLRLDFGFPVYGPVAGKDKLIFNRSKPFEDMKIHFGIGHAF
jgi:outer membrane protein assembly factor BamA